MGAAGQPGTALAPRGRERARTPAVATLITQNKPALGELGLITAAHWLTL